MQNDAVWYARNKFFRLLQLDLLIISYYQNLTIANDTTPEASWLHVTSLLDLPNFSGGKNRVAHRVLWARFIIKLLLDVQFRSVLVVFFQFPNWKLGLNTENMTSGQDDVIETTFGVLEILGWNKKNGFGLPTSGKAMKFLRPCFQFWK